MALFSRKKGKPWEDVDGFDLPNFPETTMRTLDVLRKDGTDAAAAAEAVGEDPGLSVRVLRMVNAPGFGLRGQVEDLAHACQLVGLTALESLVISLAVQDALPSHAPGLDSARFWALAARRGAVAKRVASLIRPTHASLHYTAALLSDMAVPLLAERGGKAYGEVLARYRAGEGPLAKLERETFGWDHAEAGAWMCEKWGLPETITSSIREHHAAEAPEDAVALAGQLDEVDPEKDASRVAELAAGAWEVEASHVEEHILDALAKAEE